MDRRAFLNGGVGLAGLAGLTGLAGCQPAADALRVRAPKGGLPPQLLRQFQAQHGNSPAPDLALTIELERQYKALQDWHRQAPAASSWAPGWVPGWVPGAQAAAPIPDLLTLGDYWLAGAIRQGLVQPLDPAAWPHWAALSPIWKELVTRNVDGLNDPQGQVWGAPYRWGATAIAYRRDILADRQLSPPTDWSDLWRPEFAGRISLLDQPREVIGLVLRQLDRSYNETDLTSPQLETELRILHRQTKVYSSNAYLQPLILGHTWLAMGWSSDFLAQAKRNPNLAIVFPRSGSALWADLWVRPAQSQAQPNSQPNPQPNPLLNPWIDFWWDPAIARQLVTLNRAGSPALSDGIAGMSDAAWLQRSEFLAPLSAKANGSYQALWAKIRQ
jgi:putative spermidine/putrescine transport system substrate-binding protein